eukprot:2771839-Amphidinium_carterae.1
MMSMCVTVAGALVLSWVQEAVTPHGHFACAPCKATLNHSPKSMTHRARQVAEASPEKDWASIISDK